MNEAASILVLPEGCLSDVLSLTSPRDACRAASISKEFKSASDSDAVWERFLPPDYREVIARAVSPVVFGSRKQLYLFLSNSHILLDHGYLSFQVDKESGKKWYMLGAKKLSITCRRCIWGLMSESRFSEVCVLPQVFGLEIHGKIAGVMLSQKSRYGAYLVFRTIGRFWILLPATTRVSFGGIEMETENVYLQRPQRVQENYVFPRGRKDGWMEIKLAEFECNQGDDVEIEMAFREVPNRRWKNVLIVEGIEIRPE